MIDFSICFSVSLPQTKLQHDNITSVSPDMVTKTITVLLLHLILSASAGSMVEALCCVILLNNGQLRLCLALERLFLCVLLQVSPELAQSLLATSAGSMVETLCLILLQSNGLFCILPIGVPRISPITASGQCRFHGGNSLCVRSRGKSTYYYTCVV